MELQAVGLQSFVGGMSVDRKFGSRNQFYYSRHVDFRKNPGKFSILPGTAETSGGVVIDLVEDMTQIASGVRYALGDAGNVYKIATNGTWSKIGDLGQTGGAGIVYRADVDNIYITGTTSVGRIKNMLGTKKFEGAFFQMGVSSASTCFKVGGLNTYSLRTSINEADADKRTFITDIEPIIQIGVRVVAKGTGDFTLTLHDEANNSLGSVTVAAASLKNNTIIYFQFSSAIRAQVSPAGRTYHLHMTSTVADGTIATTTASSMADCDMELWANALIDTVNGLHPIYNFINLTLIGNERYVAAYEPLQDQPTTTDFVRHKLTLPPGYEVCGFAQKNQFCLVAAEKRSSSGEYQEGAIFIWDGISETYNDWYPIPEGSPESIFSEKNVAHYIAGGSIYRQVGLEQPIKIRTFRNTDSEYSGVADSTHVNPNMMTVRRGVLLIAYPTTTTNLSLEHGIYSLGSVSREYPESFGYSYTPSPGHILNTGTNNLKIGMIKNFGDTLYMSWRDDANDNHYGVDIVNNSSAPASDFRLESLYFDNGNPFKQKRAAKLRASFNALPASCEIRLKYKIDQESSWHYSDDDDEDAVATEGDKRFSMSIEKPFFGIEFGVEGTCEATSPEVLSVYLFFDPLKSEREAD